MKFSTKCRTEILEMIYTNLGSVCLFLNWEGPIFSPKSSLGKSLFKIKSLVPRTTKLPDLTVKGTLWSFHSKSYGDFFSKVSSKLA